MLPKWIEKRYFSLFETFKDSPFRFEDAAGNLKEKFQDMEDQVNVILSELRKGGRLSVEFDKEDARRRIYRLISLDTLLSKELPSKKGQLTRGDLEALMKGGADLSRTSAD